METMIKIEDKVEVDELIKVMDTKSEFEKEELLMFLKGVNVGKILATRICNRQKESA